VSAGRLVVLVTTPRLPAGLLSGAAWRALSGADLVGVGRADLPLALALLAEGTAVEVWPDVSAADLLKRSRDSSVVWLAREDGDGSLTRDLADEVVRRAETGESGSEVEILVGSFDPAGSRLLDLVEVMDRLRRDCPWDQEQTHESLVRYLVEEAYETIEAIESGDREHLQEELGDLLLQVMFHARIASEHPDMPFNIDEVAGQAVAKMVRRHPHVFAATESPAACDEATTASAATTASTAEEVQANWETIKAAEKSRQSAMDGIAPGLPALSLAAKVISRRRRAGVSLSVSAAPTPTRASTPDGSTEGGTDSSGTGPLGADPLGEVLFTLVAAAEAAGIDAEQALRRRVAAEMAEVRAVEQRALPGGPGAPG